MQRRGSPRDAGRLHGPVDRIAAFDASYGRAEGYRPPQDDNFQLNVRVDASPSSWRKTAT
jgi:hypothetical protein